MTNNANQNTTCLAAGTNRSARHGRGAHAPWVFGACASARRSITTTTIRKGEKYYYEETDFELSEDLASEIKDDYRRVYKVKDDEEIIINRCIGIYENLVVIMIFSENQIFHSCIIEEMIGGFSFTYVCNQKIIVWKKTK